MAAETVDRLRRGPDVRRALRRGVRRSGPLVSLHGYDRGDTAPTRLAVVASRKVGIAVVRNRAKRLLREAARHVQLPVGYDIALVARRGTARATMWDVRDELTAALGDLATR